MKKYEYKTVVLNQTGNASNPLMETNGLNKEGAEGWELVSCLLGLYKTQLFCVFKREASPEVAAPKKK